MEKSGQVRERWEVTPGRPQCVGHPTSLCRFYLLQRFLVHGKEPGYGRGPCKSTLLCLFQLRRLTAFIATIYSAAPWRSSRLWRSWRSHRLGNHPASGEVFEDVPSFLDESGDEVGGADEVTRDTIDDIANGWNGFAGGRVNDLCFPLW